MAHPKKEESVTANLPVTQLPGAPPAFMDDEIAHSRGLGVSTAQEDNLVPLIYVLQTNSPQVNKRDDRYVDGAEPGDIWLRGATNPVIKGDQGFLFQPCFFVKDWVEWVPRDQGGGFVARHLVRPASAKEERDSVNPNKIRVVMPNGNELKETRNHMGYAILPEGAMAYAIPLTSSGHTVSREWMSLMGRQRYKGVKPDSWAIYYRLRTKMRHNKEGDWFVIDVANAGPENKPLWVPTKEDLDRGRSLYEAFAAGDKTIQDEPQDAAIDDKIPF